MKENYWTIEGKDLKEPPSEYYGFIYLIVDDEGRKYWGKKAFTHKTKTKLSKKARIGTRKRYAYGTRDSGWVNYWGSSKPLLEYIAEKGSTNGFKREILKLCKDRQSLAYWEAYYLMVNDALFDENCWNNCILGKFYRGKVEK